jgi:hypothetical protein
MKISDVTCQKCGSLYLMAESISVKASPGREDCAVCGNMLATWSDRQRKSFRLVLPPEQKYPPAPVRRIAKKVVASDNMNSDHTRVAKRRKVERHRSHKRPSIPFDRYDRTRA